MKFQKTFFIVVTACLVFGGAVQAKPKKKTKKTPAVVENSVVEEGTMPAQPVSAPLFSIDKLKPLAQCLNSLREANLRQELTSIDEVHAFSINETGEAPKGFYLLTKTSIYFISNYSVLNAEHFAKNSASHVEISLPEQPMTYFVVFAPDTVVASSTQQAELPTDQQWFALPSAAVHRVESSAAQQYVFELGLKRARFEVAQLPTYLNALCESNAGACQNPRGFHAAILTCNRLAAQDSEIRQVLQQSKETIEKLQKHIQPE